MADGSGAPRHAAVTVGAAKGPGDPAIVLAFCATLALSMGALAAFPAIVPLLRADWQLSNTAVGWITGSYQIGYTLGVPLLASLSDRVDARRILLASCAMSALASAAFASLAAGFWTALACQLAGGAALAGIYMPGLKGLADRVSAHRQGRFISFYTASFTVGTSAGFAMAGAATRVWGWRGAFVAAAIAQAAALAIVAAWIHPHAPLAHLPADAPPATRPQSWRVRVRRRFAPIFSSRDTMGYIWGYGAHTWELFALRAWMVPFLAFTLSRQGGDPSSQAPLIAAVVTVLGVPASIGGQEIASRIGSKRLIVAVMIAALAISLVAGWTASLPFWVAVLACSVYSVAISADSAPLTAAALAAAPAGHRGAAMAVHSTIGFTAAAIGTLAVGAALDLLGETTVGWGVAFAVMGGPGLASIWRLTRGARNQRSR